MRTNDSGTNQLTIFYFFVFNPQLARFFFFAKYSLTFVRSFSHFLF